MNQLAAAMQALKRKGPKKKYIIDFESRTDYSVRVEAVDEDEARQLAQKEFDDGNASEGDENTEITNIEEES